MSSVKELILDVTYGIAGIILLPVSMFAALVMWVVMLITVVPLILVAWIVDFCDCGPDRIRRKK